jgi:glycosyltransferase involved in cell wall biosynthesis
MLVFPSYHEGFGLPPLEAMVNSCPVVASKGTSCIQEICGDAAYYVDPSDIESLAEGIYRVATDEVLRAHLIQRGLQRARMFSWRTSAESHVKLFERLLTE